MSSYDQNLLDEAPRATRAQLQEGYNVDLLEQPPRRTPSMRSPAPQSPHPQPTPVPVPLTPGIAETGSKEKFSSPAYTSTEPKRTSFWRTRNGIIIIAILILVVVGAVVGGAVGGTVGKNTSNKDTTGITPNSASTSSSTSTSTPSPTPALPSTTGGGNAAGNGNSAGFGSTGTIQKAQSTPVGSSQGNQNIVD